MKKFARDIILYTCIPKITIIWYTVPEIRSETDIIFCHFGPLFALLPPYGPRKSKFWKNEKNTRRYYHFTHVYQKWQSYDVWFLRYGAWQTKFFVILDVFLPFYAPNNPKNKNFEKLKKTPGNIPILHKCTAKWGNIEQWGDTEQSYPFHGNSLNSAYNSHITRCLCFRLLTEGFCSPTSKFLKYPHNLWPSFFAKTTIFKWKNLMFKDKALFESYFFKMCPGTCRNICLICPCHRLLLFW